MLLFTNPAGLLGDRVGHLRTMRGLAIVGATMVLGFILITVIFYRDDSAARRRQGRFTLRRRPSA